MGSGYKAMPTGIDAIVAQFKSIQQAQAALNRRIVGLGIQTDGDGNVIIGSGKTLTVDGDEVVTGALTITGDTLIQGNLAVPNGSITNDALDAPVSPGVLNTVTADSITYNPTTPVTALSGSITVPPGFTTALVMAHATAIGFLDAAHSTQQVSINVHITIGSSSSPSLNSAGNDIQGPDCQANITHSALLTGVSGTIPIKLIAYGTYTASGTGTAVMSAIAVFLR